MKTTKNIISDVRENFANIVFRMWVECMPGNCEDGCKYKVWSMKGISDIYVIHTRKTLKQKHFYRHLMSLTGRY